MHIDPNALIEGVHVVVVEVEKPDSLHYKRRTYFNLPSAQRAVDLAHARGQSAELILCKLVPAGEPDD
ncbi:hypothetical protein ACIOTN_15510 [Glutamicibacter sp. NPDC087661]|uniref:hypothetical protein n=1 Tax=Glutamicibacter sp. NPDC087661 TaxID=3363996 RepID=UPI0037F7A4E6